MRLQSHLLAQIVACIFASLVLTSTAHAADFEPDPDWKISVYLWTTSLEGTMGIGAVQADIDLSFSDLFESLDFGGAIVARRDWGANLLAADFTYLSLSPEDQALPLGGTISPGLDLTLLSAYYGRKWGVDDGYFALLAGARYMEMDMTMELRPALPMDPILTKNGSPSFTDFIVGGMYSDQIGSRWNYFIQADVGLGGSNNSWNAQIMFQRKLQSGNMIDLGARILSVDFDEQISGGDSFVLDATMTGLVIGFTWD